MKSYKYYDKGLDGLLSAKKNVFKIPKFRYFFGIWLQYIFSIPVIHFSLSLQPFSDLGRKPDTILEFCNFHFSKKILLFGNSELYLLCCTTRQISLGTSRCYPSFCISSKQQFQQEFASCFANITSLNNHDISHLQYLRLNDVASVLTMQIHQGQNGE